MYYNTSFENDQPVGRL
ncbi:Protein of unknown function [Bacillus toyonensis]|uniref:Uncharacterized protein n=3 Tax=Bacillus cereus group TaxID=86661 RepID=A0A1C4EIL3_9BACI|nr:Protein of unknown function [Bacillus mycoides]SCC23423.1 Protein of unknown function [Bacillus wiedmannii]SCC37008.1 Protein of unknown function [Bacillus mobilis]SCC49694.1 Protein of unknown function [Bacillus thuringiensis]SCN17466.1 Protein of unknown function [Bacillus toyonensis]SCN33504.1 Protein of unknown function [Bacillus cereus]